MSLSLLDRLTLTLHPQGAQLTRQGWRGAPVVATQAAGQPVDGEADWQPALAAGLALLDAAKRRGASLRIVVADPFVRYVLLPWSDSLLTAKARRQMAVALFRHALGDKADGLEIALGHAAFGQTGVAAGLDSRLTAALRDAARQRGLRLGSLQPRLIVELAAHRKQLDDGWLACADGGWLTLLGVRGGELACLRNHRAAASDLPGLLLAEQATVNRKKMLILKGTPLPDLGGDWETGELNPAVGGLAHA